jgi:ABC-type iron transport system FetAB ATPase subunit
LHFPYFLGVPLYRTKVLYVPQRPALLPGSPTVFLQTLQTFSSRSSHTSSASTNRSKSYLPSFLQSSPAVALPEDSPSSSSHDDSDVLDPYELSKEWDLPRGLWDRNWNDLSGGEAQRLSLAVALARGAGMGGGPEIVLLDEPTSALDSETSDKVEKTLLRLLPSTDHNKSGKGKKEEGKGGPKAYILITHSQEQADRLAGKGAKVVQLGNGGVDGGQDDGVRED